MYIYPHLLSVLGWNTLFWQCPSLPWSIHGYWQNYNYCIPYNVSSREGGEGRNSGSSLILTLSPHRSCLVFKVLMIDSLFKYQTILSHSLTNNRLILPQWRYQNSSQRVTFLWDRSCTTKMSKWCKQVVSWIYFPVRAYVPSFISSGLPVICRLACLTTNSVYELNTAYVLAVPLGMKGCIP